MTPNHHPSDALLVAYSAGSLCEGLSLAVATHLAHCPLCRSIAAEIDAVGGALLEELPPEAMSRGALESVLDRIEGQPPCRAPLPRIGHTCASGPRPSPLDRYIGPLAEQRWQRIAPGVRRIAVLRRPGRGAVQLLRIAPGTSLPHHGHEGLELTMVLSGSFVDEMGRFGPGDLAEMDGEVRHQPIADTHEDCICLIATDAPLRFTGLVGRLMQPFIGL